MVGFVAVILINELDHGVFVLAEEIYQLPIGLTCSLVALRIFWIEVKTVGLKITSR